MSTVSQQKSHWKTRAIDKSEVISDAWEVTKVYCGRFAEWILYICMVMNVISIFIVFPGVVSDTILGVQVVTLDIAGFGLQSMADHADECGDKKAAKSAKNTSWFLIGLMILTILLVTIGVLIPVAKQYTDWAEKFLVLVRVVMTVIYGHVVHGLRRVGEKINIPELLAKAEEVEGLKRREERRAKELKDLQELKEKELRSKAKDVVDLKELMAKELREIQDERAKELMAKDQQIGELMAKVNELLAEDEMAKKELREKANELDEQRNKADLALKELREKELRAKQKITRKLSPQELKSYGLIANEEKAKVAKEPMAKKAKDSSEKGLKPKAKESKKVEPIVLGVATSREKIKAAMMQLRANGKELKYQEIADLAGVGYSTVKLHYKAIADEMGIVEVRKLRIVNG